MPLSATQKCVIINADDFGFSEGVSRGILRAHLQGVVTSTTVAANMPAAGPSLSLLRDAPRLGVGVHLNCTQGPPLSDLGRAMLAGPDGRMNFTAMGVIIACLWQPRLVKAIEAEFDAQIRWALDHGLKPTHLDSHRHSHAFCPIFKAAAGLARRYDIAFIRRHRERLPGAWPACPRKQRRVSAVLNIVGAINHRHGGPMAATSGTWGIAHTGQIDAAWLTQAAASVGAGVTEIMVHPGQGGGDLDASTTRLLDSRRIELEALCDASVARAFEEHGVRRINYGDLRQ